MNYFLISVSNRKNLELCIKYAMAGFTNSINGAWTFVEINEGDFISFLYGAKAFNLYRVKKKVALKNAEDIPPWPSVTFSMSGNTYYFPFRLLLEPIRKLEEPLVRAEFAYVAENLLLRGGYRRTHFQADQTTLQAVSQMGGLYKDKIDNFDYAAYEMFELRFTKNRSLVKKPQIFLFQELILQSLIRKYLSEYNNLEKILSAFGIGLSSEKLEILGEKALPEGHVDLFLKEAIPIGESKKIVIEVKTSAASQKDVDQVFSYAEELGDECMKGILIASKFSKKVINYAKQKDVGLVIYDVDVDFNQSIGFGTLLSKLNLKCLS
jgi:hypothetical protein